MLWEGRYAGLHRRNCLPPAFGAGQLVVFRKPPLILDGQFGTLGLRRAAEINVPTRNVSEGFLFGLSLTLR
ncbi:MAG: hypothetical protein KDB03_27185, partial [Planctomycetales bacterium]|nr:hypothetical protein [Planctomycetales bacterium]